LPAETAARRAALAEIEKRSAKDRETQVFIETPYRNDAMLKEILATCRATTRLAIAAELTSPDESVVMDTVAGWQKRSATIGRRPAIFLLLA
jgi:16S rRNA (cytidine1402-2'-O)-methyltransferase